MFVDSHCHLNFAGLRERLDEVIAEMAAAGVSRALCICTTLEEFSDVQGIADRFPNVWATVGVHPDNEGVQEPTEDDLVHRAGLPRVLAIGETGLDYYRLGCRTWNEMHWQRERFRVHIRAAARLRRPLVVHTRAAGDDTVNILREEGQGRVDGVFHCFTESLAVARQALDLGFHLSFSGILTFRNARDLVEVARFVPLDRCLIETDSPYLAPVPHRGRPNSPAWVPYVGAALAHAKGVDIETVAQVTSANFDRLFLSSSTSRPD